MSLPLYEFNAVVNSFHHTARRSTDKIITDSGEMSTDCLQNFSILVDSNKQKYHKIHVFKDALGRAKIIRPAEVCNAPVTTTGNSSPMYARPCSTTTIVPSSK